MATHPAGRQFRIATIILAALLFLILGWHVLLMHGMGQRIARTAAFGDQLAALMGSVPGYDLDEMTRINPFMNEVIFDVRVNNPRYQPLVQVGRSRVARVLEHELKRRLDLYSMVVPLTVTLATDRDAAFDLPSRILGWGVLAGLLVYVVFGLTRLRRRGRPVPAT